MAKINVKMLVCEVSPQSDQTSRRCEAGSDPRHPEHARWRLSEAGGPLRLSAQNLREEEREREEDFRYPATLNG